MLDRSLHDTVSPDGVNHTETRPGDQSSTERHRHTLTSRQERILTQDTFFSLYSKNPHFYQFDMMWVTTEIAATIQSYRS